jgi:hypothetical protein
MSVLPIPIGSASSCGSVVSTLSIGFVVSSSGSVSTEPVLSLICCPVVVLFSGVLVHFIVGNITFHTRNNAPTISKNKTIRITIAIGNEDFFGEVGVELLVVAVEELTTF